jgi:hypothetical protein
VSSVYTLATTSPVRGALRFGIWLVGSCVGTIACWVIASQILHSNSISLYFLIPTCINFLLAWLFGICSTATSRGRTVAISSLSILIPFLVFLGAIVAASL